MSGGFARPNMSGSTRLLLIIALSRSIHVYLSIYCDLKLWPFRIHISSIFLRLLDCQCISLRDSRLLQLLPPSFVSSVLRKFSYSFFVILFYVCYFSFGEYLVLC